jgi:hypothetical protein
VAQPIAKAAQLPERARVREGDAAGPDRIKVSSAGQVLWVVQSTDAGFATLGELSLGPNAVNVLGRFGGQHALRQLRPHERRSNRLLPGSAAPLTCR